MTILGVSGAVLAEFAVLSAVIEITPGPNMVWLAVVAATEGRRVGLAAVAGVCLGLALMGLAAGLGLAAVLAGEPGLYAALKWAGVAYLVWLAWDGWRGAGAEEIGVHLTAGVLFRRGLVTNLLNPKAALFYVSVLPGFLVADAPPLGQMLVLTALYVAIATAIHAGIVAAAGTAERLLTDPVREARVRRALALLLLGVAVWFAWKV